MGLEARRGGRTDHDPPEPEDWWLTVGDYELHQGPVPVSSLRDRGPHPRPKDKSKSLYLGFSLGHGHEFGVEREWKHLLLDLESRLNTSSVLPQVSRTEGR